MIAFNVLLNITDLLAPRARTQVITNVIPNAIKSGGRPNIVIDSAILRPIAPPDNESKLALSAQAHALVPEIVLHYNANVIFEKKISNIPIKYSKIIFHPITNATNSPTVTYEYIYAEPDVWGTLTPNSA